MQKAIIGNGMYSRTAAATAEPDYSAEFLAWSDALQILRKAERASRRDAAAHQTIAHAIAYLWAQGLGGDFTVGGAI